MSAQKPRLLIVGRMRYRLPLNESLERKFRALEDELRVRVLGSALIDSETSTPTFRLVPPRALDGPRFYAELPARVARELRSFDPDVVVAESPYEAAAVEAARRLTRSRAKLVAEA